jgi:hypothetical protein
MSATAESVELATGTNGHGVGEAQTQGRVHAVAFSRCARLTMLGRVDYTDGFRHETGLAQEERTAEDWGPRAVGGGSGGDASEAASRVVCSWLNRG